MDEHSPLLYMEEGLSCNSAKQEQMFLFLLFYGIVEII